MERKKKRKSHSREFKLEAVRLLETSGHGIGELEEELGIGSGCLNRWRTAFEKEVTLSGQGNATDERIRALEREVAILRDERDILGKLGEQN